MKHIRVLHNTKSNYEFDLRYRLIDQKWRTWKLTKFSNYFQKQWVKSKFKNWQLFSSKKHSTVYIFVDANKVKQNDLSVSSDSEVFFFESELNNCENREEDVEPEQTNTQ